ncbi:MAG: ATP-dependent RNA helicase HrpA [Pseudonocardia sp.]|nr:ATP-dependent RNA helicase HrpA [Pseudonocardia sp.]
MSFPVDRASPAARAGDARPAQDAPPADALPSREGVVPAGGGARDGADRPGRGSPDGVDARPPRRPRRRRPRSARADGGTPAPVENGGAENGGAENGGAENGGAENGPAERDHRHGDRPASAGSRRRRPSHAEPDPHARTPRLAEDAAPEFSDAHLDALAERLPALGLRDEHRLARRLDTAHRTRDRAARNRNLAGIATAVDEAEQRIAARRAALPAISYPETLPVSARREDIAAAIRDHQVVIVAGETGSGKTTQIPKICLELGRGVRGLIGHTQPRRLAARTVAARIAEELHTEIGEAVGWRVRFTDQVGDTTLVKLMTDGILLAELTGDRMLWQYDTLIIDEAHERSLNIDFILGYLAQLLPRRPDLKVIITSATIDPERFSRHFGGAPIVEVSGRSYPVEVRYRPVVDPDDPDADPDRDQLAAIADAVTELRREGPGDILVFLPGEREIRDAADALAKRDFPGIEILPLFARQTTAEQQRVFAPKQSSLGRRVVLATNVAETSLTVPGIRYVIDPGLARISRYSRRLKVQRLPIEKVSQASANQRAGRCGRVADGICIRLYAEDDFDARPLFTDPEILRTNLASVVLQMISLELGEITEFPFVEPPDVRSVNDGIALLQELGALDGRSELTPVGRQLAALPVDPRLGRMLVEADRNGALREVLVIAAALSVQDPRERPTEQRQAADEKHARFAEDGSDFLAFRNLWTYVADLRKEMGGSRFRKTLREEFLHYLRIREWQDLHAQLRSAARNAGMTLTDTDATAPMSGAASGPLADRIHISVLAGLLSQVGLKEGESREYLGARNAKFMIFPGSTLAKKQPRWVMAAELVETSALFARTVARIKPEWIEPLAGHLVRRTYSEPHWSRKRAAAVAVERVTLYGIPIVVGRNVDYGRIDPEVSRELFIRHALVEGDWDTRHRFFHANRALLEDAEELETRARRRDLVVDEETLVAFYEQRIPAHVVSGRHFDSWWKKNRNSDLLDFTEEMVRTAQAAGVDASAYPDHVEAGGLTLPLSYAFEPGRREDGVTVDVPVAALHQIDPTPFTWQVPGLREDLVTALIKTLPKNLRRNFAPAPDHARAVLARLQVGDEPLLDGLERELGRMKNIDIPREAWELNRLPEHLTVTFRVVDEAGREVTRGTDLEALRHELAPKVRAELAAAGSDLERRGLTTWTIGALPREHAIRRGTHVVTGFPGLVDRGSSADVRVFPTAAERDPATWRGVRRLLLLDTPSPAKQVTRGLDNAARLALSRNPHGSVAALVDDCVTAAADGLIKAAGGPAWDERGYLRLQKLFRERLATTTLQVLLAVRGVLDVWHRVQRLLADTRAPMLRAGVADITAQLAALAGPGFVTAAGASRLGDLARYLEAIERRIEKLRVDPARDAGWTAQVRVVADEYAAELAALPQGVEPSDALCEIRWMIEELRVGLYAHPMRTRYPVSIKRIQQAIDALPR